MKQTVLITGGTGLVGQALTEMLVKKNYSVIVLTRNCAGKQAGDNVTYAEWDVKKQIIDKTAIEYADYIVHLAGAGVVDKRWTADYKNEIRESRTQSSRLIVHALETIINKVKAVVSASAIGYYGPDVIPERFFTEEDKADESFLGETCKLWEASIEPVKKLDKRLVWLRIGIVLSSDGGAFAEFRKPVKFGLAAILSNGKQVVSWVHIEDLCRMFIEAMENESFNGIYNAVAPNPVSNETLTVSLAKAMKGKFYIPFHVPAFLLKLMLGESSVEILKSATVSSKKIEDTGFSFNYPEIDAAIKNMIK